jgi:inosose dehydratase
MSDGRLRLGTAPVSWGIWFAEDEHQLSWEQCLNEISQVGYRWIELGPYGYLPTDVGRLRDELEERDLRVSGTFAMGQLEEADAWSELEAQVIGACESLAAVGAHYLIVIDGTYSDLFTGEMLEPAELDDYAWETMIDATHRVAGIAQDRFGLRAVFHPHAETHVETEAQIERFLADTDPELIGLCLDTGHHAYRAGDPVDFYRRHADRVEYFHFKNVDRSVLGRVGENEVTFAGAVAEGVFCEPSMGVVDFPSLMSALDESDFEGHATVEQDMYPTTPDKPYPIAKRTFDYLTGLTEGADAS